MTTSVSLSLFTDRVRPEARGLPTVALGNYVLDAAITFCERSRYWREDLTPLDAVEGQAIYLAEPPTEESVIEDVVSVRHNGRVLEQSSQETLDSQLLDWRTKSSGQAKFWFATARDNVTLVPYPCVAGEANIDIRAALKPSRIATTLPQILYDDYMTEIASGALAKLLVMPNVPWAAPDRATYHAEQFEEGVRRASLIAAKGYNRTPLRTRRAPL